jgi:23S rRNA pseudouridine2605 synthase
MILRTGPRFVDLLGSVPERVYPVGRLDYDSKGLLLLTNDGDFAQKIQHPRFQKPKIYKVKIQGHLSRQDVQQLRRGINVYDDFFKPENLKVDKMNDRSSGSVLRSKKGKTELSGEGLKKSVTESPALWRCDGACLGTLKEGEWRHLTRRKSVN